MPNIDNLINVQPSEEENKPILGFKLLIGYFGLFMVLAGIIVAVPLLVLVFYFDCFYAWWYYLVPAACSLSVGIPLYSLIWRKNVGKLKTIEAMLLTILIWLIAIVINALPFLIWSHMGGYNATTYSTVPGIDYTKSMDFSSVLYLQDKYYYVSGGENHGFFYFTQAIFESTSGLCSVGLSLFPSEFINGGVVKYYNFQLFEYTVGESGMSEFLVGTEIFQFHRAWLSFIGGVGLVLILTSALSDKSSFQIYLLEGHSDKLMPNLAKSARTMFKIYIIFIIFGTVAYSCCGMSVFDAMCYSMAALSTGGFANHATSMAFYQIALGTARAISIETITIILMVLGATSFLIHHFFIQRKYKNAFLHYENLAFILIAIVAVACITTGFLTPMEDTQLYSESYSSFTGYNGFRYGIFEFASAITTTGFCTISSYRSVDMAPIAYFAIIFSMFIGGMSGSTAGGIKLNRICDIFVAVKESIVSRVRKTEVVHTPFVYKYGEKVPLDSDTMRESLSYAIIYSAAVLICSMVVVGHGHSFADSIFEVASAYSGTGTSSGVSSIASSQCQWGVLWTLSCSMLLGRLEIVIAFIIFIKAFREIQTKRHRVKVID